MFLTYLFDCLTDSLIGNRSLDGKIMCNHWAERWRHTTEPAWSSLSNLELNSHFPTRVSSLFLIAAKNTGKRIVLWRRSVGS